MALSGLPCISNPSEGFIIDTAFEKNNPLYHRLKKLECDEDLESDSEEARAEINKKISLTNVLSDIPEATNSVQSVFNGSVLIAPPPNLFEGIAKKMSAVTSDGGLLKHVRVDGYADCPISETDYVTFNYSGWLDGQTEPFSSTYYEHKPMERQIGGLGPVFIGLDLALLSMKKGEVAFFLTCPAFSYGPGGTRTEPTSKGKNSYWPEIKDTDWLLWKIEVTNVISAADHVVDIFDLSPDDRLKLPFSQIVTSVNNQLELGKDAFKNRRYGQAKKYFERGAKLLVEPHMLPETEVIQKKSLLAKLFRNIAIAHYQTELNEPEESRNYQDVFENAASAVKFDENDAKAWYWGGFALRHLYRLDESREYLSKAAKLQPRSSEIGDELRALENDCREQKEREKVILKKMVGVDGKSVRKIPVEIENLVAQSFRTSITEELESVYSKDDYDVQFDLNDYNKSEIDYINAAISFFGTKVNVRRFDSESGSKMIFVAKKKEGK